MVDESDDPPVTIAGPTDDPRAVRRWRAMRRVFFCGLTAFLVLGLVGVMGPRTGETSASAEGWEVSVAYPRVSRPGLSARVSIEIRRPGGFDVPVVVAADSDYFDAFDESSLEPAPVDSTADSTRSIWTFAAPTASDTLVVDVSGRVQPGLQLRWVSGQASILVADQAAVTLGWKTFLTP